MLRKIHAPQADLAQLVDELIFADMEIGAAADQLTSLPGGEQSLADPPACDRLGIAPFGGSLLSLRQRVAAQ
jgi:hypothetical protein